MQKFTVIQYRMRIQRALKVCTCERRFLLIRGFQTNFPVLRQINGIIYELNAKFNE